MKRTYIVRMILMLLITTPIMSTHDEDLKTAIGKAALIIYGSHPVSPDKSPRTASSESNFMKKPSGICIKEFSSTGRTSSCVPSHRVPPTPSPERPQPATQEGRIRRAYSAFSLESSFAQDEKK